MWLLIVSILYNTPRGVMVKYETVDSFQTEKACMAYAQINDKHLKRIKKQTNIKEWSHDCYKQGE